MDLGTIVVSFASSGLVTAGVAAVVGAVRKRKTAPTDNAEKLSDAAMRQVDQFQERAERAEQTADRTEAKLALANTEVDRLRNNVYDLQDTVAAMTLKLHGLVAAIHDPYMDIHRLRAMVPLSPPANGTPGG